MKLPRIDLELVEWCSAPCDVCTALAALAVLDWLFGLARGCPVCRVSWGSSHAYMCPNYGSLGRLHGPISLL